MGIVVVAALAASAARSRGRGDHGDLATNQVGRQRRQPIVLNLGPTVDDRDVLALDVASLLQTPAECAQPVRVRLKRCGVRNPITGIADCCARRRAANRLMTSPRLRETL